jgi:hypothetical protein
MGAPPAGGNEEQQLMGERRKVKVSLPAASRGGYIELDGVRQTGITAISVHGGLGEAARVTLEIVNVDVELEADAAEITRITETTDLDSTTRTYKIIEA